MTARSGRGNVICWSSKREHLLCQFSNGAITAKRGAHALRTLSSSLFQKLMSPVTIKCHVFGPFLSNCGDTLSLVLAESSSRSDQDFGTGNDDGVGRDWPTIHVANC